MASYSRIRTVVTDHLGLARSKYQPADRARATKHCITLFSQHFDKQMTPGAPGSDFFSGMPDFDACFDQADIRPGWEPGVGVVVCDLMRDGELLAHAPRTVLRRAIEAWEAHGFTPMIGVEFECYMLIKGSDGTFAPLDTPGAMTYGVGPLVDPAGVLDAVMERAAASGLRLETVNSEFDAPQFEFTLEYGPALQAIDDAALFKLLAQETAAQMGHRLTFMGKPFAHLSGSGLHLNISFQRADGTTAMNDAAGAHGLSDVARWSIAGMLAHHEAVAAIGAPTVNAYKRLRPGQLAGFFANWGIDHRSAAIRVPAERDHACRIEHRMADGAANPYLTAAALLTAARLGYEQQLDLADPETGDSLETANTQRIPPANLGAACDALEADHEFVAAFGQTAVDNFVAIKRDEWAKFNQAVTDWEINYYGPFL
jgi:glutamine synthetase